MQRALRTAHLAGFTKPTITALLREVDYGEHEGLTTAEIRASDPTWELYRDGSPGGESPEQIYARAAEFVDLVARRRQGRVLAFSHGHFSRAVAVAWIDAGITVAIGLQLDVATLNRLTDTERGRVISLWNSA